MTEKASQHGSAPWKRVDSSGKKAEAASSDASHASRSEAAARGKAARNRKELPVRVRYLVRDADETQRRGEATRRAFQTVFGEWNRPGLPADEIAVQEGIEAQIAAASLGYKPLYFDPWGQEISEALAAELRKTFPADVEVHAEAGHLFVYQTQAVQQILDADASFYRPNGEDDLTAIARVSEAGDNGDLLGYGARNLLVPLGARVTIENEEGYTHTFFVSDPDEAEHWAALRAGDIEVYTRRPVNVLIEFQSENLAGPAVGESPKRDIP